MKNFYLLLIFIFIAFGAYSQENNSRLNVKSLKLIENDTEASRARKKDGNGDNCALIKIQTPNMGESERNRIEFQADLGTFLYPEQATGEIKLFLTEGCKTLIIKHPEYGKLVYSMPIRVEGFKTYEMVLEARKENLSSQITLTSNYVKIKVMPADAVINIDGNFYSDGNAYITVDEPHNLVVSHELYHDYEQTIYASSKEKLSYTVNLAPAYGWLIINSEPESSATVLINGVRKGVTPFRSDTLASGEYDVTLMKDMYESVTKTVVVRDNNEGEITIPMRPNFAEVTVTTDSESQIYIDDILKGNASWKGRLIQGQHKIEARKASHRTSVRVVDVIAGKDENVVVEAPTPIYGAINVTSSPAEAKVYLDGKELDETPFINNTILVGKHTLRFEKKGCATLTKEIFIEEGNVLNVNEKFDTGKLISITTGRNGDNIYVDGELIGKSPIEVSMGYGSHTIKAVRDGKKIVKSIDVNVNGGQTNVPLEFGKIVIINTDKDGDEIFIDEELVGKSPCSVYMAFGEHGIKIKRGNFIDEENFKLTETVESHLNYNLGGMITIKTNKSGDNIYVDSEFIGYSPRTITASAGNHKVKVTRYGNYKSVEKNVNIKSGKKKEILLKIKEKKSPSNNFKRNLGINIGGGVWMNMDLLFDFNLYVEFLIHENFGLETGVQFKNRENKNIESVGYSNKCLFTSIPLLLHLRESINVGYEDAIIGFYGGPMLDFSSDYAKKTSLSGVVGVLFGEDCKTWNYLVDVKLEFGELGVKFAFGLKFGIKCL